MAGMPPRGRVDCDWICARRRLQGGDSGSPAIVPGKPEESELIRRVTSPDDGGGHAAPGGEQAARRCSKSRSCGSGSRGSELRGALGFRAAPEGGACRSQARRIPSMRWSSPGCKRCNCSLRLPRRAAKLCRRLYLDLIGLPPSPQEVEAFEQHGIEATIESLLHSERFGEKWARHWLDAARYSDTNGYEKDMPREQWAWRDWVINALNRDMPYDQFLIEQIAGDLLPDATQEQIVATGFLRNSMLNEEGAIVPEQFRIVEMFDRMDCLGKAVLGLTTQCAQCHSHKFDPLTQDEYYGMFAFLNNSLRSPVLGLHGGPAAADREIENAIRAIEQRLQSQRPQWQQEMEAWESEILKQQVAWTPLEATELGSISGLNHPTQEADKSLLMRGHPSGDIFVIARPELQGVTGLRLEALNHGDLPFGGPGRSATGTWGVTEIEVFAAEAGQQGLGEAQAGQRHGGFLRARTETAGRKERQGSGQFPDRWQG